jgi:ABC-type transport system involved in multi-copper enzyme maturation permease subunit
MSESADLTPARDEVIEDAEASLQGEPASTGAGSALAQAPVAGWVRPPGRLMIRRPAPRAWLGRSLQGVTAIGVKELRGRMRGRRAFVILTIYLLLLAAFAWMMTTILQSQYSWDFGSPAFASPRIGQGIFTALLLLQTLLVVALAPAFTAGAISTEREKQTLDLLITTPISSLAIVLGKLLSALIYIFILVFASIPLTAIVFVYGGVAPDDVVRGYAVLLSTALGLGALGIFFSAILRRTQAATVMTYFAVLGVTLGSAFIFIFWSAMLPANNPGGFRDGWSNVERVRPPEALLYLNPYVAQADVLCGVESGSGTWCSILAEVTGRPLTGWMDLPPPIGPAPDMPQVMPGRDGGVGPDGVPEKWGQQLVMPEPQAFAPVRDTFWPRSSLAWLLLSAVLVIASVRFISPTHRWRPRLPGVPRRLLRRTG